MKDAPEAYFAFGANMARRVLVTRRRILPLASEAAVLPGYAMRFTQRGLPLIEPAFADIWPEPGERVHGVLHLLRPSDLRRLDRLEGSYERIAVTVHTARGPVEASAYSSRLRVRERDPSRRYLHLLIEGAREHGLPEDFVRSLEARRSRFVPGISHVVEGVAQQVDRLIGNLRGHE